MKESLKICFYAFSKLASKINFHGFSNFLIGWGYVIKSESLYYRSVATTVTDRYKMHQLASTSFVSPQQNICFLEFGVFRGDTFIIWAQNNINPQSSFTGFDTFTGLPEDWGKEKKGSYSAEGKLPDIKDSRVMFRVGLIQNTLPGHVKQLEKGKKKVIHIDVDLYNATLFTLINLHPFLEKGDILIFDDFFTITKSAHEFKAFYDYQSLFKINYKPLIKCRRGHYVIEIQ